LEFSNLDHTAKARPQTTDRPNNHPVLFLSCVILFGVRMPVSGLKSQRCVLRTGKLIHRNFAGTAIPSKLHERGIDGDAR